MEMSAMAHAVASAHVGETTLGNSSAAPSNAEILRRSKAAYATFQATVDTWANALASVIDAGTISETASSLNAVDWAGEAADESVVAPVFEVAQIRSAVAAMGDPMQSCFAGVFSNALPESIGGKTGVIGFARSLTGNNIAPLATSLDIFSNVVAVDPGRNVQLAQWLRAPRELHDAVYGLYLQTTVHGVALDLKVLLDQRLEPYGFVESTGASVRIPVTAAVFSGHTVAW